MSIDSGRPPLVTLLVERDLLKDDDLAKLPKLLAQYGGRLEEALVRSETVKDVDIAKAYSEHLNVPLLEGREGLLDECREVADCIDGQLALARNVVPLAAEGNSLDVAFQTPSDLAALEEIQFVSGCNIRVWAGPYYLVHSLSDALYGGRDMVKEISDEKSARGEEEEKEGKEDGSELITDLDRVAPQGKEGQIIKIVNILIAMAIKDEASDIHLEPYENEARVRYRIDGHLLEVTPPPKAMFISVISRLKVLAKMDIAERRIPQDGAISVKLKGKRVDLRVNTCPTVFGEKMVLRILDKQATPECLTQLGFSRKQADDFEKAANSPHGLMFVTGPTGSGKSTTLYTCLSLINKPKVNIATVEDPVEYRFHGLNQCHVRSNVGLTFAAALRAFLRQDPDIIMVGEVRNQETAVICLRAALTGHLVLSTLHTNNSLQAINRLIDMGVEPFLLGPALRMLQAQRLVRKVCDTCKEAYELPERVAERYGLDPGITLYRTATSDCPKCRGTGYKGRVGLFEVIPVDETMAGLIMEKAPYPELEAAGRDSGCLFLSDSARDHVIAGHTTLDEVAEYLDKGEDEAEG